MHDLMTQALAVSSIPHRPPFLFVDQIVEVSAGRIVTRWHVDPEAAFFRGHYPKHPVMPGVLLCECCFQAGALLIVHRLGAFDASQEVPVVTRIQDARFKRMVRPGDHLQTEVTVDDELDGAYCLIGRINVEGQNVLRVKFACMAVEA